MVTQRQIEHSWDAAKLLITKMDAKVILYTLPQYGLYVESITPVLIVPKEAPLWHKLYLRGKQTPHIVSVRTQDTSRVADFIQEHKEFQAYRIFKHGLEYKTATKDSLVGIACETVKNMLSLFPGKIFRINSKDREVTNLFYEIAVGINEEHGLGCSFDFDEYDYTLLIKKYKRFKEVRLVEDDGVVFTDNMFHRWAVITILYGEGLPNSWSMKIKEIEGVNG